MMNPKSEKIPSPSKWSKSNQRQSSYQPNGSVTASLQDQNVHKAKHKVTDEAASGARPDQNGKGSNRLPSRLQRRQSTPLMPAFMVSAPGKVIVFGEHAVVHGKVYFGSIIYQYTLTQLPIACDCRCNCPSLISTCNGFIKTSANSFVAISRYISRTHMEH